jgi:hypothetical protein
MDSKRITVELNERELGTVLASLRFYQHQLTASNLTGEAVAFDLLEDRHIEKEQAIAIGRIASQEDTAYPLADYEIDALCERLNVKPNEVCAYLAEYGETCVTRSADRLCEDCERRVALLLAQHRA